MSVFPKTFVYSTWCNFTQIKNTKISQAYARNYYY